MYLDKAKKFIGLVEENHLKILDREYIGKVQDYKTHFDISLPDNTGVGNMQVAAFIGDKFYLATIDKFLTCVDLERRTILYKKQLKRRVLHLTCNEDYVVYTDSVGDIYASSTKLLPNLDFNFVHGSLSFNTSLTIANFKNCNILGVAEKTSRIKIIDITNPDNIIAFCFGHTLSVNAMSFVNNQDRLFLVSGGRDSRLILWDVFNSKSILLSSVTVGKQSSDLFSGCGHDKTLKEETTKELRLAKKGVAKISICEFSDNIYIATNVYEMLNKVFVYKFSRSELVFDRVVNLRETPSEFEWDQNGKLLLYFKRPLRLLHEDICGD